MTDSMAGVPRGVVRAPAMPPTTRRNILSETTYIGVVGPDTERGTCRDSISNIQVRQGDYGPVFVRATKGFEARQLHVNMFLDETTHDYLLLLDHDMVFQADTLERLRSHNIPYVSGLYMRRSLQPMAPIWFRPFDGRWPMKPWVGNPERGKLHPIGASGWGCMLMHRDVILAVRDILKGEQEILEDDMDIWPYRLDVIMRALNDLQKYLSTVEILDKKRDDISACVRDLASEIRPLRADREIVGSDIRFPFFALQAGYQLMGDPDVRPGHLIEYSLTPDDYGMIPQPRIDEAITAIDERIERDRTRLQAQYEALL